MLSKEDFISQYEKYTDDELFAIYSNMADYSDEAKEALGIVVAGRGGVETLVERQREKMIRANEAERIRREVVRLSVNGADVSFLQKMVTSTILAPEQVHGIIAATHDETQRERKDKQIKPRTVLGSVIGGSIASVLGGVLWGLQMIWSGRMFLIFIAGLALLSYGSIRLFTRQSGKNTVVVIATIISVLAALFIGQLLYEIIGYQQ